jgi:type I restriction enzyme, S subunit
LNQGVDRQTLRAELDVDDAYIAHADDILFAWSGSLGVHRWPGDESLINQHIFKVIPEGTPKWFVHRWIEEHMDSFRSVAADKATTMGHIQRKHLAEAKVAVPSSQALDDADRVVGPIDQHRAALVQESRTLTELREALLPKLISGEIRVPDTSDPAEVIEPMVA